MANFLRQLESPQINPNVFFEVMRDFRKGGLTPENFEAFKTLIASLPPINQRDEHSYNIFNPLGLRDVTEEEFQVIIQEVQRRTIEKYKKCWHPQASPTTCNIDANGRIIVTAAHSIQNNGILSRIAENGHVMTYAFQLGSLKRKKLGKNIASIFYGFCNTHDAIYTPIETAPYSGTNEQNFLFAYRAFIVSAHKKMEASALIEYGDQANNDMLENEKLFNQGITAVNYDIIETEIIELPASYPIAASGAFYLDFDFDGNPIHHSEERMEFIFVSLFPEKAKTYFLLSYFKLDATLYGNLGNQLRARANFKLDISVLLASHIENIYFNPVYYDTFIAKYEQILDEILTETQFNIGTIGDDDKIVSEVSFTPHDYLENSKEINYFGY